MAITFCDAGTQPGTGLRRITADGLTADQEAMLSILGNPVQRDTLTFMLMEEQADGTLAVVHYACPVVEVLGAPRSIHPNGDVHSMR